MANNDPNYLKVYLLKDEKGITQSITFTNEYAQKVAQANGYTIVEGEIPAEAMDSLFDELFGLGKLITVVIPKYIDRANETS